MRAKEAALAAIPVADRISARQFCDIQWLIESGKSDAEIAAHCDLPLDKLTAIIAEGDMRTVIGREADKTKDQKMRDRWVRAVGLASRSLSLAGFAMAMDAAKEKDAFKFSLAARGTKAFVDMARQAEGLDKDGNSAGALPSVNLFFFNGEALPINQRPEKQAEPVELIASADELGFA